MMALYEIWAVDDTEYLDTDLFLIRLDAGYLAQYPADTRYWTKYPAGLQISGWPAVSCLSLHTTRYSQKYFQFSRFTEIFLLKNRVCLHSWTN